MRFGWLGFLGWGNENGDSDVDVDDVDVIRCRWIVHITKFFIDAFLNMRWIRWRWRLDENLESIITVWICKLYSFCTYYKYDNKNKYEYKKNVFFTCIFNIPVMIGERYIQALFSFIYLRFICLTCKDTIVFISQRT